MARRKSNIAKRRIKKALKKVRTLKAWTARTREEVTHLINRAEKCYQEIVQIRGAVQPHILAAQTLDAQVNHFILAYLAQNGGD